MANHAVQADAAAVARGTSSVIVIICALAALASFATNIILPSLPQLARDLRVSSAAATRAIPVFLLAFSVTQLVIGPLSDRYGRATPALAGLAVTIIGSIWCAYARDLTGLLIARVVQSAAGGLAGAIARDLFGGNRLEKAMAYITIATAASPGFSPLLGGALDHFLGWRWEFLLVAAFVVCTMIGFTLYVGETNRTPHRPISPRAVARTYVALARDPHFYAPATTTALLILVRRRPRQSADDGGRACAIRRMPALRRRWSASSSVSAPPRRALGCRACEGCLAQPRLRAGADLGPGVAPPLHRFAANQSRQVMPIRQRAWLP